MKRVVKSLPTDCVALKDVSPTKVYGGIYNHKYVNVILYAGPEQWMIVCLNTSEFFSEIFTSFEEAVRFLVDHHTTAYCSVYEFDSFKEFVRFIQSQSDLL